jgi:hypothetical protein
MRRDSADVPSEVLAGPGRRSEERATRGVGWCSRSRGRPPLPGSRPSLAFRTLRLAVRRHRRQLHGLRDQGTRRDPHESRSRRLPPRPRLRRTRRAEPEPFTSRRAAPSSPGTSSPADGPVSRCPRERPLPETPEGISFGRRVPPRRSRSARVVSLHLGGFLRSRLPACCSRYRVRVRQVSGGSVVEAEASRAGSVVPAGAPTLRRFAPRRQPCRIAAACSPPAVRRLRRPRGRARASLRPRPRTRRRFERFGPSLPVPPFPAVPPASRSRASRPPFGDGLPLRCAVRPSVDGLPHLRKRRAPGPCRVAGRPAVALPAAPHLAVSARPAGSPSSHRFSPTVSVNRPRLQRFLEETIDPGVRTSLSGVLAPFRWWLSAPSLVHQGPAAIASCPRPAVA